jgi:hypothetical protein
MSTPMLPVRVPGLATILSAAEADVVPPGRSDGPHGGDDLFVLSGFPDFAVDLLGGRHAATRGIDPQDNRLDATIFLEFHQLGDHGLRIR